MPQHFKKEETGMLGLSTVTVVAMAVVCAALLLLLLTFFKLKRMGEGNDAMRDVAQDIREGADAFMKEEYSRIIPTVVIVAALFTLFIEVTSGVTFLIGATMSSFACVIGMKGATLANVRTTNRAKECAEKGLDQKKSVSETVKVALRGGMTNGIGVQAFGLLGLILIMTIFGQIDLNAKSQGMILNFTCNPFIMRFTTYSLGCSLVAMFNRVAGGNYTKAADIGADILGKNVHDLPEDSSANPLTVADQVGDNVNDSAGNSSDLLESFVATIAAGFLVAQIVYNRSGVDSPKLFSATITYVVMLATCGLFSCLVGMLFVMRAKGTGDAAKDLNKLSYISAALTAVFSIVGAYLIFGNEALYDSFKFGWFSPVAASFAGILSGIAIGKITEYYTSADRKPVRTMAADAVEGVSFEASRGDAVGFRSVFPEVAMIAVALLFSGMVCGAYGIAISALGMLSFVSATVTVDAFGPISDNAGGIAEVSGLSPAVRDITDKLDAVGNTTAAIAKGFAIGSAAFATFSLILGYVGSYSAEELLLNIADYRTLVGGIFGFGIVCYFMGVLNDNTNDSAHDLAKEAERQLRANPGILQGKVKPNYEKCITKAAKNAISRMVLPSVIALVFPVAIGVIIGPSAVGGLLIGATFTAVPMAIYMGNSGGAYDNAKKLIESGDFVHDGQVVEKGSEAHKASVNCDTIGDTRKDVIGVALDIFIKMMSTVANTLAPIFSSMHLM